MKSRLLLLSLLLSFTLGCVSTRIVIPTEPEYKRVQVHIFEQGMCMDSENMEKLFGNVKVMKAYQDALVKELKRVEKNQ